MVIDLIIPTYKPRDKFQESLKRLALQTRKPDRIILVNTEAEFFDEEMITPYDNVEVHHIKKEELSVIYNYKELTNEELEIFKKLINSFSTKSEVKDIKNNLKRIKK